MGGSLQREAGVGAHIPYLESFLSFLSLSIPRWLQQFLCSADKLFLILRTPINLTNRIQGVKGVHVLLSLFLLLGKTNKGTEADPIT